MADEKKEMKKFISGTVGIKSFRTWQKFHKKNILLKRKKKAKD